MKKLIIVLLLISSFLYSKNIVLEDEINGEKFVVSEIINSGSVVWGMDFLDDENLIFTQRNGNLYILNLNSKKVTKIKHNLKIFHNGQGGLLDIKASPKYEEEKFVYITYSKDVDGLGATTLIKAKIKNQKLTDIKELLQTKSLSSKGHHFGSRVTFDDKGNLYFGVGDRGNRDNGQNLKTHAATIMKLKLNGEIPKDNPFYNSSNALKEIYSYGVRNPQGLFFDKKRDILFEIEHGPRGGDEINIIKKGSNYGWPVISYGMEYWAPIQVGIGTKKEGMEQPLKYYVPSIAPSSIIVYQGDNFKFLKGALLSTALKLQHLNIIYLDEKLNVLKEDRILSKLKERLRNVVEDSFGNLYISTDSGKILKMERK